MNIYAVTTTEAGYFRPFHTSKTQETSRIVQQWYHWRFNSSHWVIPITIHYINYRVLRPQFKITPVSSVPDFVIPLSSVTANSVQSSPVRRSMQSNQLSNGTSMNAVTNWACRMIGHRTWQPSNSGGRTVPYKMASSLPKRTTAALMQFLSPEKVSL